MFVGIYAGLVTVETKCLDIAQDPPRASSGLSSGQWQNIIAHHRSLLHEHHDFLIASQHPQASPALRRLATKYAMPTRMWHHGIQSFLELLWQRCPETLEHMLTYLEVSRSMINLLMEDAPHMVDEWLEMDSALEEYRNKLQRLNLQRHSSNDVPDLSSCSPESLVDGCSSISSPDADFSVTCPGTGSKFLDGQSNFNGELEFGDWYFHCYPPATQPEPHAAYRDFLSNRLSLPDYVINTLVGWLYCGQVFARNFNVYCKIFTLLSFAAR